MNTVRPGYILPKVGVWCTINRQWIVGPIFFTATITSDVYVDILMQFIALLEEDERECIFQQDGAWLYGCTRQKSLWQCCAGSSVTGLFPHVLPPPQVDLSPRTISCGNTCKITFLKQQYQMRTYSVRYSKIFDDGQSCAKMFWEPSSNTLCKIKSFSSLQCSVFVGCEF